VLKISYEVVENAPVIYSYHCSASAENQMGMQHLDIVVDKALAGLWRSGTAEVLPPRLWLNDFFWAWVGRNLSFWKCDDFNLYAGTLYWFPCFWQLNMKAGLCILGFAGFAIGEPLSHCSLANFLPKFWNNNIYAQIGLINTDRSRLQNTPFWLWNLAKERVDVGMARWSGCAGSVRLRLARFINDFHGFFILREGSSGRFPVGAGGRGANRTIGFTVRDACGDLLGDLLCARLLCGDYQIGLRQKDIRQNWKLTMIQVSTRIIKIA